MLSFLLFKLAQPKGNCEESEQRSCHPAGLAQWHMADHSALGTVLENREPEVGQVCSETPSSKERSQVGLCVQK